MTKFNIKFLFGILSLFIILQVFFSFVSESTFLSNIGLVQSGVIFSFILFLLISRRCKIGEIFLIVALYQCILVFFLYFFYNLEYSNPLGYNPSDAVFYHDMGEILKTKSFSDSYSYLVNNIGLDLADIGFPILLKVVYGLGGDGIISMKFLNIVFHLLTSLYIYKVSKLTTNNFELSRNLVILYGLNPFSIYFNSLGLKEPVFVLLITLSFYFSYKWIFTRNFKFFVLGFIFLLSTALFRIFIPIFIIVSFGGFYLFNMKGRHKTVKKLLMMICALAVLSLVWIFIQKEMSAKLNYDPGEIASYRLGRKPGILDYLLMYVGGLIGPFPSFQYVPGDDIGLHETAGNYIKIVFSYFFLLGAWRTLKNKIIYFYPLIIFIFLNLLVLTVLAASLDPRFLYLFFPFYFLIVVYGLENHKETRTYFFTYFYSISAICLVIAYNFR